MRPKYRSTENDSRTVQSFRDETNLGQRIRSMMRTPVDPRIPKATPSGKYTGAGSVPMRFLDARDMPTTFHEMQDKMLAANRFFDSLPLEVKVAYRFQPGRFFDALVDPNERDRLIALKVLELPKKAPPTPKPGSSTPEGSPAGGPPKAPPSGAA